MSWAVPHPIFADFVVTWGDIMVVAPLLAAAVAWWIVMRTDEIVHHVFPHLAWEHSLGWLNIKAERRANTALRWMRYGIYLLLFDALAVMLWTAQGLPPIEDWSDPAMIGEFMWRIPMFGLCVVIWVLFLGCGLLPKARARREMAGLKTFRLAVEESERERGLNQGPSRVHKALPKPRVNSPLTTSPPAHRRRYDHPSG